MTPVRSRFHFVFDPTIFLIGFGLIWFSDTFADADLWGHIRFGQDTLRTGSIIRTDTYSYRTGEQSWVNHEWLSEVIFAVLYNLLGPTALIVFKVLVSLLILGLSCAHLRCLGLGPLSSVLLLILVCIPFRMGLGPIRPQIFTYLLFVIQLLLLQCAAAGRGYLLWVLPILYVLWANLHGGVLAGVGVLGLWIVVRIFQRLVRKSGSPIRTWSEVVQVALVGLACGLALLVNPYRAELAYFLLRTATVPRPEIHEWDPLTLMSLPGQLYLGLLMIGIAGLVGSHRRRAPEAILILGVAAQLPLISLRHYPFFALTLVVLAGEHIADVWNRWRRPRFLRFGHNPWLAGIGFLGSLALIGLSLPQFGCIRVDHVPARAVAFLKQTGVSGNMAVPFNWGEYVLWQLGPRVKVSIDGRRETIYSYKSYRQSIDFERGTGVWDALLKSSRTDMVLVRIGSPTDNLMIRTAGWVPLYQDKYCRLFTREGFLDIGEIVSIPIPSLPDDGDGLCFPAPRRTQ
jgi:hypothetical protein